MNSIKQYCLENRRGTKILFSELGAGIREFWFRNRSGEAVDIVLGFDSDQEYLSDDSYMGAVVGPYANRIGGGRFSIHGQQVQLSVDSTGHTLHGGDAGIHQKRWRGQHFPSANSVWFTVELADGEGGFPGNRRIEVRYKLSEDDQLHVSYSFLSDRDTVANLTQHSYFNLDGHDQGSIEHTLLSIYADRVTEVDQDLIPTGKLLDVAGTPLDFHGGMEVGEHLHTDHPSMQFTEGYDHNFELTDREAGSQSLALAAQAYSNTSGIQMDVYTDQPGMQFYSGNHIAAGLSGKAGAQYGPHHGFCLETQNFPDAPNHVNFPSPFIQAGVIYRTETRFALSLG